MHFLDFLRRQKELLQQFSFNRNQPVNDTTINIRNFEFESAPVLPMIENKAVSLLYDPTIQENHRFSYPVFIPKNCLKSGACILMLHVRAAGACRQSWTGRRSERERPDVCSGLYDQRQEPGELAAAC